jgi:hypothetical protein
MSGMRSIARLLPALVWLAGCAVPRPFGDGVALHTLLSGGYRVVDHETFEHHPTIALAFSTRDPESGWGYEAGAIYAKEELDEARDPSGEFAEGYLGFRRSFRPDSKVHPYLGFGAAYGLINRSLSNPNTHFQDQGGGVYARAGLLWKVGRFAFDQDNDVMVGIDLRSVLGNDYDSSELSLILGFGR